MTSLVRDRLGIAVLFNGQTVPLQLNSIDYIHIVESVRLHLPMLTMRFSDTTKFLTRNNLLVDGIRIGIGIQIEGNLNTYYFRLFSHKEEPNAEGKYTLTGYYDSIDFWNTTARKDTPGTSEEIISALAEKCGLYYDGGTSTNDTQQWLPGNKKICTFVMDVCNHAYVDDQSCMAVGVTALGELRFKNLTKFNDFPVMGNYASASSPPSNGQVDPIVDHKVLNRSGFFNNQTAYDNVRYEQDAQSTTESQVHSKVDVVKNSKRLMVSTEVNAKVGAGTVSHSPIDCGNVHDKYERAYYQNMRLANLFSYGMEILVPKYVKASILDAVNCHVTVPDIETDPAASGKYLVTSKVLYIQGLNYYYKLEIYRHGVNDKNISSAVNGLEGG